MIGGSLILLVLPCVVSGYVLINARVLRYRFPERAGSNEYLRVLAIGSFWVFGWDFALRLVMDNVEFWKGFRQHFRYLPLEVTAATGLSLAARLVLDAVKPVDDSEMLKSQTKHMELFIHEAISKNQLIMVTLSNAKVYVGKAVKMSFSGKSPQWLMIFPLVSGHRCETDKGVKLEIFYLPMYKKSAKYRSNWPTMVLSVKEVITIQLFDADLYQAFQQKATKR